VAIPAGRVLARSHQRPDPLAARLCRVFERQDSARHVGRAYLDACPRDRDERRLVDLLCSCGTVTRADVAHADTAALRRMLGEQLRSDFEHGRTVNVQGWILSETEGRLCALAAMR
jgi:hypothetical protein